MSATLYQRILDAEFELLPEPLRDFHGSPNGACVGGTFRVERGPGWFRNLLATIAKLPPAGQAVPLRLDVEVTGEEELWTRSFGDFRIHTRQLMRERRLVELHGPWTMTIRLGSTREGMRFDHERCDWHGIPLPGFLAPKVDAVVEARGDGWFAQVAIGLPLVGMVCRYSGEVRPL